MRVRSVFAACSAITMLVAASCANLIGFDELRPCVNTCHDQATRLACSADEAPRLEPCPSNLPHCVADGRCVRCVADADCPTEPNEEQSCIRARCIDAQCTRAPKEKASCGKDRAGVCNAAGVCMGSDVVLTALRRHSCLRAHDGQVYCWGANDDGELGDGTRENRGVPVRVKNLPPAHSVVAGYAHTCALIENGDVYCWGRNDGAQVGNGIGPGEERILAPSKVVDLPPARILTTGQAHSCVLTRAGEVWCWGYNDFGQCGTIGPRVLARPIKHPDLTDVGAIDANKNHTCVLRTTKPTFQCWGSNAKGQLADKTLEFSAKPLAIEIANEGEVVSMGLGFDYNCAIVRPDNRVYCWGRNHRGQLGNGGRAEIVPTPVNVLYDRGTGPQPIVNALSLFRSDGSHMCLRSNLIASSPFFCWGADDAGETALGAEAVGVEGAIARPTTVLPPNTITMAHGEDHACILVAPPNEVPEVRCYGAEDYLGTGTGPQVDGGHTPQPIPTPLKWDPASLVP